MSDDEEREIKDIIELFKDEFIDYHKLKTRKSGNIKHIYFHITLNANTTVKQAHDIIGNIKKEMNKNLKNSRITIHIDPSNN